MSEGTTVNTDRLAARLKMQAAKIAAAAEELKDSVLKRELRGFACDLHYVAEKARLLPRKEEPTNL
jgi:hypothetical protein